MSRPALLAAALTVALTAAGCASSSAPRIDAAADAAQQAADRAVIAAQLQAILDDPARDAKNLARDIYRHPRETLLFFGVAPQQTVIEITPGSGWYSEILAPYLRDGGRYVAALVDPLAVAEGKPREYQQRAVTTFDTFLSGKSAGFDAVQRVVFNPTAPVFGPAGQADAVLTFRNVHNWVGAGSAQAYFDGFFRALKPGGVLGVVDHRAKPGTDIGTMKRSGYLTEALVIDYATKAGFVLEEKSEINANPRDTADHPNGVWTLPPSNRHEAADADKYRAIGESDRMTLRFRKPR